MKSRRALRVAARRRCTAARRATCRAGCATRRGRPWRRSRRASASHRDPATTQNRSSTLSPASGATQPAVTGGMHARLPTIRQCRDVDAAARRPRAQRTARKTRKRTDVPARPPAERSRAARSVGCRAVRRRASTGAINSLRAHGLGHHLRLRTRREQRRDRPLDSLPFRRARPSPAASACRALPQSALDQCRVAQSVFDGPVHQPAHERRDRRRDARRYQHPTVARRIDGAHAHCADLRVAADAFGARLIHRGVETASEQRKRERMLGRDVDVLTASARARARAARSESQRRRRRRGVRMRLWNRDAQRRLARRAGRRTRSRTRRPASGRSPHSALLVRCAQTA